MFQLSFSSISVGYGLLTTPLLLEFIEFREENANRIQSLRLSLYPSTPYGAAIYARRRRSLPRQCSRRSFIFSYAVTLLGRTSLFSFRPPDYAKPPRAKPPTRRSMKRRAHDGKPSSYLSTSPFLPPILKRCWPVKAVRLPPQGRRLLTFERFPLV